MFINVYGYQMIAKLNQKLEGIVKNADTGKLISLKPTYIHSNNIGTYTILYWEDDCST